MMFYRSFSDFALDITLYYFLEQKNLIHLEFLSEEHLSVWKHNVIYPFEYNLGILAIYSN